MSLEKEMPRSGEGRRKTPSGRDGFDEIVCRQCGRTLAGDGDVSANQLAGEAGWELEGDRLWTCSLCERGEKSQ